MSRATHARFLARQAERRQAERESNRKPCGRCGSTVAVRRYVADSDPFGMWGALWLCPSCAPVEDAS
jgi:hypothetical protein